MRINIKYIRNSPDENFKNMSCALRTKCTFIVSQYSGDINILNLSPNQLLNVYKDSKLHSIQMHSFESGMLTNGITVNTVPLKFRA